MARVRPLQYLSSMNSVLLALSLIFGTSFSAQAAITVESLTQVLKTAQRGDLVVLDIDDTLITREPHELDNYQKYMTTLTQHLIESEGMLRSEAERLAFTEFARANRARPYYLTEKKIGHLIRRMQRKGIKVIGLTGRHPGETEATEQIFQNQGLKFFEHPREWNQWERIGPGEGSEFSRLQRFRRGIIYAGYRGNKGEILKTFLNWAQLKPTRILFVDDSPMYLNQMETAFARDTEAPLTAYKYTGAARRKAELCAARVEAIAP